MNKKLFFGMFAAATMLLATSCQNEEMNSVVGNGEEATVTFTIGLNNAVGTRAISDGTTVDQLVWEVYDKNGNTVEAISKSENAFNGTLNHTLELTLAKGQTYTFAFWAQKSGVYNVDNLKEVGINYENASINDESRDAFCAYTEPITVTGNFEKNITLKRPFAQLNLAVSDLQAFNDAGISLNDVSVVISDVATQFDVTTGAISGEKTDVTFSASDVLCNGVDNKVLTLKEAITIDGVSKKDVDWLSMNYLLVNAGGNGTGSSNVDVEFTVTTSHDIVKLKSTATPVQRNWRTNIIASLTDRGVFKIVIDKDYENDHNHVGTDPAATVMTAEELKTVFEQQLTNGKGIINIDADIVVEGDWEPFYTTAYDTEWIVIQGNNHTISGLNNPLFKGTFAGTVGLEINDLSITNSEIVNGNDNGLGRGIFISYIDHSGLTELNNCHAVDVIVHSEDFCGLVAYASGKGITMNNCSAINCTFDANGSVGAMLGHGQACETVVITNCKAENCVMTIVENRPDKVGALAGRVTTGFTVEGEVLNCKSVIAGTESDLTKLVGDYL